MTDHDTTTDQTTTTVADANVRVEHVPTGLLIGGTWRPASGGATFDVRDPSTGQVLA